MYTFNPTAIGVLKGLNKRWQPIDLSLLNVSELISDYRIVQIEVTAQGAFDSEFLLLHDLSAVHGSYSGVFSQLLNEFYQTAALPTRQVSITRDRAVARYYDVFTQRMTLLPVDASNVAPSAVYDADQYDHLRISRKENDFESQRAATNLLVNINGFYHRTQNIADRGLFVRDGYKSLRVSNQNQAAFWDFSSLGGFTIVPNLSGTINNGAISVTLPQDISNKTVFFVIAGYFFTVDGLAVSQTGVRTFLINFAHNAMRIAARFFEAKRYIDLSTIEQIAAGANLGSVDITKLTNNAAVAAWMALSQTFAIVVNRASCYAQTRYLKRTGNPNQYLCYLDRDFSPFVPNKVDDARLSIKPPNLPMVLELGRHPPYWTTTEGWVHSLTIYNNRIGQLQYETGHPDEAVETNDVLLPGNLGLVQEAYLLEIGSDVADSP